MKRIFTSAATFCALSFSLFAHPHNGQMDDQYQSSSSAPARMTTPHKWQQCLIDKEGWIEGGAEWLYLSSSLSPVYSQERLILANSVVPQPQQEILIGTVREQRINPEYNSGFTLFFRYRGVSDNDLTLHYHYLRNNGSGSLKRTDAFTIPPIVIDPEFPPIPGQTVAIQQDDKGHLHSHMNIFDLLVGRGLPLSYQMLLRLSGGLTVHDFHLFYQISDMDVVSRTGVDLDQTQTVDTFFKEKLHFWGLGPKGQLTFEYLMLPSHWNHSLNINLNVQYALLFAKRWSSGLIKILDVSEDALQPDANTLRLQDNRYYLQPDHHLIHNLNLDFGMNYRWESSYSDLIFNLAAGYRVYSFWNMYNLFATRTLLTELLRDNDVPPAAGAFFNDEAMIYGGPYIRFSIAY